MATTKHPLYSTWEGIRQRCNDDAKAFDDFFLDLKEYLTSYPNKGWFAWRN